VGCWAIIVCPITKQSKLTAIAKVRQDCRTCTKFSLDLPNQTESSTYYVGWKSGGLIGFAHAARRLLFH
jgi:hypothetical protein